MAVYSDIFIDTNDNIQVAYLGNYFNGGTDWGFLTVYNPSADTEGDLGGYRGEYVDWLGHDDMLYQFQNLGRVNRSRKRTSEAHR